MKDVSNAEKPNPSKFYVVLFILTNLATKSLIFKSKHELNREAFENFHAENLVNMTHLQPVECTVSVVHINIFKMVYKLSICTYTYIYI